VGKNTYEFEGVFMSILVLKEFLAGRTPLEFILIILFAILGISQGWLHIQGIQFKKKEKAKPQIGCLRNRSGACELLRLEMDNGQTFINKLRRDSWGVFLRIRKDKIGGKKGLAKDKDSAIYKGVLYQTFDELQDELEEFFVDNHLAEMSDSEFDAHVIKRTEDIVESFNDRLYNLFFHDGDTDYSEVFDANQREIIPKIQTGVRDVFTKGRTLSIKFKNGELDFQQEGALK